MDDWGVGSYEDTALALAPVSEIAVAALRLAPGEQVLDVACGTGNAALLAARAGARPTGLDGSQRLLTVARDRIPDGLFVHGDAAALPFADGHFDAAVSVFGLIFARPAERVAAEVARVVRPGGRLAITTWPPRGPVFEAVTLMRQAVARVRPPQGPPPTEWGDATVVERLLAPYGALEITEHELAFASADPAELWDRWERLHPMWIGARQLLEPARAWNRLRHDCVAALGSHPAITSPYLLAVLQRG